MTEFTLKAIKSCVMQFDEIAVNFLAKYHPEISYSNQWLTFSYVFQVLFEPFDEENSENFYNMLSWLKSCEDLKVFRKSEEQRKREYLYEELSKLPIWKADDKKMLAFFMLLFKIYSNIMSRYNPSRGLDQIFGFMTRFPAHKTKVVLLGQEPAPSVASSGFAFHESPCLSTRTLLQFLNNDLRVADIFSDSHIRLAFSKMELSDIQSSCQLHGWIDQSVLLMNCKLTLDEPLWFQLTERIVQYLCEICPGLVLIATGKQSSDFLCYCEIDQEKHRIISVNHPARGGYNKSPFKQYEWAYNLPFLNANFFLHEQGKGMIDWSSVSTYEKDKLQTRLNSYIQCFDNIPEKSSSNDAFQAQQIPSSRPQVVKDYPTIISSEAPVFRPIQVIHNDSWHKPLPEMVDAAYHDPTA